MGVTLGVGSTGMGVHGVANVYDKLNLRLGYNWLNYDTEYSTDNGGFKAKLHLSTFDLLLDFYPFPTSSFRLTGGAIINGNNFDVTATAKDNATYQFNGNTYQASSLATVKGKIKFDTVAPYLGLGWGNPVAKDNKLSIMTELGVMFQGAPKASLEATSCTLPEQLCGQLRSDLAKESKDLQEKVSIFKTWPVLRIALTYKF